MKKILVIGSNSFTGSNFIDYALSKNYEILGISRSNQINKIFLKYLMNKNIENFKFFKCDLNNNLDLIKRIIIKYKPNFIVNFAAQGMVAESWIKPNDWYKTNIISQVDLINIIKQFDFIEKFLQFSTPEVYGSTKEWIKEDKNFSPTTPYAISRAAFDSHILNLSKFSKFPMIITRTANVFGPGQQLYRVIPRAIISTVLNKRFYLHGDGNSQRSFIHIKDVSSALIKILQKGKIGNTYHISTNRLISIKNLIKMIFKIEKNNFAKTVKFIPERLGKDQFYKLDSQKIRKKLGWKDNISLEDGILDTVNWIKKNKNIIKNLNLEYIHKK
jgi:dTDP-glucose 4,6-dehydratase